MRINPSLHSILFAAFPVLFLYELNAGMFGGIHELWGPLAATTGSAALLFLILERLIGDSRKAALITTVAAAVFFGYGHLYEYAYARGIDIFPLGRQRHLMIVAGLLLSISIIAIMRTKRSLETVTSGLIAMAVTLTAFPTFGLLMADGSESTSGPLTNPPQVERAIMNVSMPDIFYIMPDAYTGSLELERSFGYDNSAFEEALEARGFRIARKSISNYDNTILSLPSTLNMTYMHDLFEEAPEDVSYDEIIAPTRNNRVLNFLKEKGYTTVHLGHYSKPTQKNEFADINIELGRGPDVFWKQVARLSVLAPFMQGQFASGFRSQIMDGFAQLERTPRIKGPKFVFAHVIFPHKPYVVDADGNPIEEPEDMTPEERTEWEGGAYLDHVTYANKRLIEAVDAILAHNDRPTAILIQSDHGVLGSPELDHRHFAAFRLPGADEEIPQETSAVNAFRLILNAYFDTDYALLPNRAWKVGGSWNGGYDFTDLTDVTEEAKY